LYWGFGGNALETDAVRDVWVRASSLPPADVANTLLVNHVKSLGICQFFHTFSHPTKQIGIRGSGFLNSGEKDVRFERKIDNHARVSGATQLKLMAYLIYGLGLALSYIYIAYLCIIIPIKIFLSSACGRC